MRILVVEDDPISAMIVRKRAEILGHVCECVGTGDKAWERLQRVQDIDVVLSGWHQPGMTGSELCRHVREVVNHYTSFIFVTAVDAPHLQIEAMNAGADGFLTKPIDLHDLHLRLIMAERIALLHRKIETQAAELRRLNKMFYAQGRLDALTAIPNRLQLDEDLREIHQRAEELGIGYSLAMIDVDKFKVYNDTFGHPAGDEALRTVAATLARSVRDTDRVYRYGGEEFCVLITSDQPTHVLAAVDRLRAAIERVGMPHAPSYEGSVVTISGGVSTVRGSHPLDIPEVLRRADAALYAAKHGGRNRVHAWTPELGAQTGPNVREPELAAS